MNLGIIRGKTFKYQFITINYEHDAHNHEFRKDTCAQEGYMLETPEERIKLLRAGLTGKAIERLYIEKNNFKIIDTPTRIEMIELELPRKCQACISQRSAAEWA